MSTGKLSQRVRRFGFKLSFWRRRRIQTVVSPKINWLRLDYAIVARELNPSGLYSDSNFKMTCIPILLLPLNSHFLVHLAAGSMNNFSCYERESKSWRRRFVIFKWKCSFNDGEQPIEWETNRDEGIGRWDEKWVKVRILGQKNTFRY